MSNNSIKKAFENEKAFISFITAGDPSLDKTEDFILALEKAGSNLIELGIPFSDPIAEGTIIEKANLRALSVGTKTDKIFEMMKSVRKKTSIPIVFLTYMNPIFVYGSDRFFKDCKESGVDGLIIPDLPFEERHEVNEFSKNYDIPVITLIAPTSNERIELLSKDAEGFIYLVSSMGVTGVRDELNPKLEEMMKAIKKISKTPVAVGFGISKTKQAKEVSTVADGIIVGSALVNLIEEHREKADDYLYNFVKEMKDAMN